MTVSADALRLLHRIHRQLADLREQVDHGPKQIKARELNVTRLENDFKAAREKTTAARMAVDQKQLQLKIGEAKILDLRTKLNTCGTNREYQALLEQIAADEMSKSVLEDEILEALDKIEQLQVGVGQAEQGVGKGKSELEKVRQDASARVKQAQAEIARLEAELADAEKSLPADFRSDYQRMVRGRGDDAMAAIESACCSGCHQQITPNTINQLMMGQVVCCKSCGRLLYMSEDE